jgi:N,N'-diacetyllegionaminate synthase
MTSTNGARVTIIAEMANAHDGSVESARSIIEAAAEAGADAINFQRFSTEELLTGDHPNWDEMEQLTFLDSDWEGLVKLAHDLGLTVISEPFGRSSAEAMASLGTDLFQIHASDLSNAPLLRFVASFGKAVYLCVGGANLLEVSDALTTLREHGAGDVAIIHGFQGFPTAQEDTNLRRLAALQHEFGCPVGIADHVDAESPMAHITPLLGVMAGATMIEKHLTLDRSLKGTDYVASLNPREFETMVKRVRDTELIAGSAEFRPGAAELRYRKRMKKAIVASRPLTIGTSLDENAVEYKRAPDAPETLDWQLVHGRRIIQSLQPGQAITLAHVELKVLICVSVRAWSKRLPKKALLKVKGEATLSLLLRRLKMARAPQGVVVCTTVHPNDDAIADIASQQEVPVFRGSELDVMGRTMNAAEQAQADIVVRVTGDNVLTDPDYLDKTVVYLREGNLDYVITEGLPDGLGCSVVTTATLRRACALAEDLDQSEYMTWYLDQPAFFKTGIFRPETSHRRPEFRFTLDFEEDFTILTEVAANLNASEATTGDLIAFLDKRPDLQALADRVKPMDRTTDEMREKLAIRLRLPRNQDR